MNYYKLDEQTYRIQGRGCDCYLLLGEVEAIMIDSGCDYDNIQAYAQTLTSLPVKKIINTHSHFDHTGGNGYFEEVYMSEEASFSAKNFMDEEQMRYCYAYEIQFLREGSFPFQGRPLEIVYCDVHSPGNLMILDKTHHFLFTGDEIDQDQVLLLPGFSEQIGQFHARNAATVQEYKELLLRLWQRQAEYEWLCTGHNGSPLSKDYIWKMITCCEEILASCVDTSDVSSATYTKQDTHYPYEDANYARHTYEDVALVYCRDDLYNRRNNSHVVPATPLHRMCEENVRNILK